MASRASRAEAASPHEWPPPLPGTCPGLQVLRRGGSGPAHPWAPPGWPDGSAARPGRKPAGQTRSCPGESAEPASASGSTSARSIGSGGRLSGFSGAATAGRAGCAAPARSSGWTGRKPPAGRPGNGFSSGGSGCGGSAPSRRSGGSNRSSSRSSQSRRQLQHEQGRRRHIAVVDADSRRRPKIVGRALEVIHPVGAGDA